MENIEYNAEPITMIILNKYRNDFGRLHRKEYDSGLRNSWCIRSNMRSYQCRQDGKSGVLNTFLTDNLVLETYATR